MRGTWAAAGLVGGMLLGSCVDLLPYLCSTDEDCTTEEGGRCEPDSFCSYPDDDCPTGRRYSDLAGNLSGQCAGMLGGSGESGDTTTTITTTTTTTDPTLTTSVDGSSSDDGNQPVCGDDVTEGDEECDDGNELDGDGCNTDCVRSGSIRWEQIVAGDAGQEDLYFGLTLLGSGDVLTVGHITNATDDADILISRWPLDGMNPSHVIHDAGGSSDLADAVIQGDTGEVYICGSSNADGTTRPWISQWPANLSALDEEVILTTPLGRCLDVSYITGSRVVAVGGDGDVAWTYSFDLDDLASGNVAEVMGMAGNTNLRSAVRDGDSQLWVAGEFEDFAVVYQPDSETALGSQVFLSAMGSQVQSIVVFEGRVVLGGYERRGDLDLRMQELTTDGDPVWEYTLTDAGTDEIEDIAIGPAGGIYAVGHLTTNGESDRWVARFDPDGTPAWARADYPMSELGRDRGRSILVLPESGDLIVVAELSNGNDLDAWIARLAP